jgi:hypothetical protein
LEKMLDAPCPYHETVVKHEGKNKPHHAANAGTAKSVEHDEFPKEDGVVMMIFGGMPICPPRCKHKRILQEIYHNQLVMPSYLKWSETATTYDQADHPNHIPQSGTYPLVVALLFGTKQVHKVLMDGGSSLNIVYMSTLDCMGIQRS